MLQGHLLMKMKGYSQAGFFIVCQLLHITKYAGATWRFIFGSTVRNYEYTLVPRTVAHLTRSVHEAFSGKIIKTGFQYPSNDLSSQCACRRLSR